MMIKEDDGDDMMCVSTTGEYQFYILFINELRLATSLNFYIILLLFLSFSPIYTQVQDSSTKEKEEE